MKIEDTDEMNELRRERDNWKESAAQCSRNADFYRGIVCGIGAQFGVEARTSDDGSIQDTVLALKVPELVEAALTKLSAFTSARPDSPECVEALAWDRGCDHPVSRPSICSSCAFKVLALNLRALIVREGEAVKKARAWDWWLEEQAAIKKQNAKFFQCNHPFLPVGYEDGTWRCCECWAQEEQSRADRLEAELADEVKRREKAEGLAARAKAAIEAIEATDGKAREIVKELLGVSQDGAERMWFETSQDLMRENTAIKAELAEARSSAREAIRLHASLIKDYQDEIVLRERAEAELAEAGNENKRLIGRIEGLIEKGDKVKAELAALKAGDGGENLTEWLKCADASTNWKLANLKRCADGLIPLAAAYRHAFSRIKELESLREYKDMAAKLKDAEAREKALGAGVWRRDSDKVEFDRSVMFGKGYDFFGLENLRQELHTDYGSWVIWPNDGKWSAYGDRDGGMMFEKFSSEQEAKDWVLSDLRTALNPAAPSKEKPE